MPTREQIITFDDAPPPPGQHAWVDAARPASTVEVVDPDPAWPQAYEEIAGRIRGTLGWRALDLAHVGSTAVPGLAAKPVIDVDLTVADPDDEDAYVPALAGTGFVLRVREPWWYGHRMLRAEAGDGLPQCHLHVFGPDSPEPVKHRLFREWLRGNPEEREAYAAAKRAASAESSARGEHGMQYNARKEAVVREIYQRAFAAAGLLTD